MQLRETVPGANISRSLPTATLVALTHRAGQCLLEGEAQNSENSRRLLGGTRRLTFSKRQVKYLNNSNNSNINKIHHVCTPTQLSCFNSADILRLIAVFPFNSSFG
jgi:hypothetical protein